MSDRVKELYFIIDIKNVMSVMAHGILSNEQVRKKNFSHIDISNPQVQSKRDEKVAGGLRLHQYANLYFCPRNPMLFYLKSKGQGDTVCVLRISKDVLKIEGVVLTDQNAASSYALFFHLQVV